MDQQLSKEEVLEALKKAFPTPVEFLSMFDDDIKSGRTTLYGWQVRALVKLAKNYTILDPCLFSLRAVNGSGKDKFIIAGFACWKLLLSPNVTIPITSSSGFQLKHQTEKYISNLCKNFNAYFGSELFDIKQREIKNLVFGGECLMFATDEGGKAEGFHPRDGNSELILIVNEAKSVDPVIFSALERCTGFTMKIYVSSPGEATGDFYESQVSPHWTKLVVKSKDCEHFSKKHHEILITKYGADHPLVKSMLDAEFASEDMVSIITADILNNCFACQPPPLIEKFNRFGLDLAAGGNKNVLTVVNGNQLIKQHKFSMQNTALAAKILDSWFKEYGARGQDIFADASGLGIGILDNLVYNYKWVGIHYVFNQSKTSDPRTYKNLGVENWYHFRKLLEDCNIVFCENKAANKDLIDQLLNRRSFIKSGILHLEPKHEAIAKGRISPDEADSAILAFCSYEGTGSIVKRYKKIDKEDPRLKDFSLTKWSKIEKDKKETKPSSVFLKKLSQLNNLIGKEN